MLALAFVPALTGVQLPAASLAAPFVLTSGAVVGTRLLLPNPTVLNVALPAVGSSLGLVAGVFAGGWFGSFFLPEHTQAGSFRNNASTAGFVVAIVGGAALGTAAGVAIADGLELKASAPIE